jgi:hypothetical protein
MLHQHFGSIGCRPLPQGSNELAINMSHEADMNRSDRTYQTSLEQFSQALPGKNDIYISIRITVIVIIVRDRQFFRRDSGGNVSEAWIT